MITKKEHKAYWENNGFDVQQGKSYPLRCFLCKEVIPKGDRFYEISSHINSDEIMHQFEKHMVLKFHTSCFKVIAGDSYLYEE